MKTDFYEDSIQHLIKKGLRFLHIKETPSLIEQCIIYLSLLKKWNKIYNLTAIKEPEAIVKRHLLDSLSIVPYLKGESFIDVGTGPGLPGIPLALLNSNQHWTLLDSNIKKITFLRQAIYELNLSNVRVVHSRVEAYNPKRLFDAVVTRAFSSLDEILIKADHLCKPQGCFLAMKGTIPSDEIKTIPSSFRVEEVVRIDIPELDAERHLVIVKRQKNE